MIFTDWVMFIRVTWAQYERYELANDALKQSPLVVFMGNSITDFWAKMMPDFFDGNNYIGRGISGQTTQQMLSRFRQDVVALNPKVVVILAGINDIAQNNGEISNANILQNIVLQARDSFHLNKGNTEHPNSPML